MNTYGFTNSTTQQSMHFLAFVTWQEALGSWFCRQSLWKSSNSSSIFNMTNLFWVRRLFISGAAGEGSTQPFMIRVKSFGWFFCGFATKICKIDEFTFHRIPTWLLTNGGSNGWSKIMPISTYKNSHRFFTRKNYDFVN